MAYRAVTGASAKLEPKRGVRDAKRNLKINSSGLITMSPASGTLDDMTPGKGDLITGDGNGNFIVVENGAEGTYLMSDPSLSTGLTWRYPLDIIDAKGDLIVGTADDTPARLPAGETGQILTVDPLSGVGLVWADPPSQTTSGTWVFVTNVAMADPTPGRVRFNNTVVASVTEIAIDILADDNVDFTRVFLSLIVGDIVFIQDKDDATTWARFQLTASPSDMIGWFRLDGTMVSGGGTAPGPNNRLVFAFSLSSGGSATPDIPLNTIDAAGDLLIGTGPDAIDNLPIGTNGQVLTVASGAVGWQTPASTIPPDGSISTVKLADNSVTNEKLRDSIPLSVIGRPVNSPGDPTDIQATGPGYAFRRVGSSLGFGFLDLTDPDIFSGVLQTNKGGTGQSTYAKGDTLVGTPSGGLAKLPVGSPGTMLYSEPGATNGLTWTQAVMPFHYGAKGIILVGTGAGTFGQLAVGTDGQVLTARASDTGGVYWAKKQPWMGSTVRSSQTIVNTTTPAYFNNGINVPSGVLSTIGAVIKVSAKFWFVCEGTQETITIDCGLGGTYFTRLGYVSVYMALTSGGEISLFCEGTVRSTSALVGGPGFIATAGTPDSRGTMTFATEQSINTNEGLGVSIGCSLGVARTNVSCRCDNMVVTVTYPDIVTS